MVNIESHGKIYYPNNTVPTQFHQKSHMCYVFKITDSIKYLLHTKITSQTCHIICLKDLNGFQIRAKNVYSMFFMELV